MDFVGISFVESKKQEANNGNIEMIVEEVGETKEETMAND